MQYFSFNNSLFENKLEYKRLARKLHPDSPTGNTQKFQEMQNQWDFFEANYQKYSQPQHQPEGEQFIKNTRWDDLDVVIDFYEKNKEKIIKNATGIIFKKNPTAGNIVLRLAFHLILEEAKEQSKKAKK